VVKKENIGHTWFDMDESEDEKVVEVHTLLEINGNYKSKTMTKPTNCPKWAFKLILADLEKHDLSHRHKKWIASLRRKIDKKGTSLNRYSLMELLHENGQDTAERAS
jgi:hypothetical protein